MNTQKSEMEKIGEIIELIQEYKRHKDHGDVQINPVIFYDSNSTAYVPSKKEKDSARKDVVKNIFYELEKMLPKFNVSMSEQEKSEICEILYESFGKFSINTNNLVTKLMNEKKDIDVLINHYFEDKKGTSLVEGYINIEQLKQEVKEEIINELKYILTHNTISIEQQKNIISIIAVNELSNNNQEVNDEKIKATLDEMIAESKNNLSDEDKQKLIDETKEKVEVIKPVDVEHQKAVQVNKEESKDTRNVANEENILNNRDNQMETIKKSIDAFFDASLATLSNDQKAYPELGHLEKNEHLEKILMEIRKLPNGEDKLSLYYSLGGALEKLYELKPELIGKYTDINDTLKEINREVEKVKNNFKTEKKDFITKIFKRRTKDSRPLKGKVTKKRKAITNIKKKLVGKFTTIAMVVVLLATNVKGSQKINATSENDILSNTTIEQTYDENEENKQAIQEIVERYEVITKDEETFDVSQQPTNSTVEELNLVEGQTYDFSSVKKGYKSAYSLPEDKVDLKEELAGNLVYVGSKGNKALFAQADEFGNIKKDEQGKIMYMAWYDLTEEEVIEAIQAAQKGRGK